MAQSGLRVTVIVCGPLGQETMFDEITYQNKNPISVHEILRHFAISKPRDGNKIWIKRDNPPAFRETPYEMDSQLPWDQFNNCVIVIARTLEAAKQTLNPAQTAKPAKQPKSYEEALKEQTQLWQEKKKEKEKKGPRTPKSAIARKKVIRAIIKKKRKAQIELEQQKRAEEQTQEN